VPEVAHRILEQRHANLVARSFLGALDAAKPSALIPARRFFSACCSM
jgi:hypothetical protein